ncbi:EamA family transporter [Bacillus sp. BRMEA1]|uniref:DMT family transporter n=1 Tax=Neobacillus endophyticus TaxID=2738405 RepID=UPI001563DDD8|nr:EamA family transporter [Neobacillus endophyticus]NRD79159.1 EamA family transporter [Neobacillus endophyticus]
MRQNLIGAICLSLAASMWGSVYVISKYILEFVPPLTLVWLRYVIAFVFLFALLKANQAKRKKQETFRKRDWLLLGWIGFIGYFISIACQFIGTKLTDAHTGALITSATPAFIVIFAKFVLNERFTVRKVLAVVLATSGVVVVVGWRTNIGNYFWGSLILVGAAITWALLSVYVKLASQRFSSLTITTYAILFAFIFTTPEMLWELHSNVLSSQNIWVILGVIYLGIVATAGAFFLWNKGMELMDAGIGSLFFFFQPIVGAFLGWLLLNEKLNIQFFIGGSLIVAGVLIVTIQKEKVRKISMDQ